MNAFILLVSEIRFAGEGGVRADASPIINNIPAGIVVVGVKTPKLLYNNSMCLHVSCSFKKPWATGSREIQRKGSPTAVTEGRG